MHKSLEFATYVREVLFNDLFSLLYKFLVCHLHGMKTQFRASDELIFMFKKFLPTCHKRGRELMKKSAPEKRVREYFPDKS